MFLGIDLGSTSFKAAVYDRDLNLQGNRSIWLTAAVRVGPYGGTVWNGNSDTLSHSAALHLISARRGADDGKYLPNRRKPL